MGIPGAVVQAEDWVFLDYGDTVEDDHSSTGLRLLDSPENSIAESPRRRSSDFVRQTTLEGAVDVVAPPSDALILESERLPEPDTVFSDEPVDVVGSHCPQPGACRPMGWQMLPTGLLFHSYLAGEKEPRMAAQWLWDRRRGRIWETALGGRWGLVRYGTYGGVDPEGFQFDMEGAAFARVDPEHDSDLEAVDFRAGFVATVREGRWRFKTGYYHISSHIGDEYLLNNSTFVRINYVRDAILTAAMYDITPDLQIYGEIALALNHNGGADPYEFQFGAQYSPMIRNGKRGAPFAAINGHLRQEFDFGGSVNVMAGWQWRSREGDQLFRVGFQHYNGPSMQWELFDVYESLTGFGIWYDY
ncbi:MAG: DUF1207 domain-containing protein [Planctomycetaceae bacterium]|nr:DUF1207 domain-containing protein [Planctomycetaceae bacterium]